MFSATTECERCHPLEDARALHMHRFEPSELVSLLHSHGAPGVSMVPRRSVLLPVQLSSGLLLASGGRQ